MALDVRFDCASGTFGTGSYWLVANRTTLASASVGVSPVLCRRPSTGGCLNLALVVDHRLTGVLLFPLHPPIIRLTGFSVVFPPCRLVSGLFSELGGSHDYFCQRPVGPKSGPERAANSMSPKAPCSCSSP